MDAANPARWRWLPLALLTAALGVAAGTQLEAIAARSGAARPSAPAGTMPVSEVKRGMKGYALTVFHGEVPERFEIEVVDVIRNYLPKQDAILFRALDPRLEHSGIVGGMSGSPIYIDGKLVGALAYGWRFNKDPLGGITPIENMLAVGQLPYRPEVLPRPRTAARKGTKAWADTMLGLDVSPLPARRRPNELTPSGGLEPLGVPMAIGGLGPAASALLAQQFGFAPVRGGATGKSSTATTSVAPKRFSPGDSVSVVLVAGDNSVAPNGTVTWVSPKGETLLAFGHPMFGEGPSRLPFADAHVHTIIPSVERSLKLSSALDLRGSMVQDRQAAIALRTDVHVPLIPVTTTFTAADALIPQRIYENGVAFGIDITPNLLAALAVEAVEESGGDATEVVLHLDHEFDVSTSRGRRTVRIANETFFPSGVQTALVARNHGAIVASAMLDNDFEVARIERVRQAVRLEYGAPLDQIMDVRLTSETVHAGDLVQLELVLRNYRGSERIEVLPLRIPDDAGDQEIEIEIAGGNFVRPYRPMPNDLDDLIDNLEHSYTPRSIVVSIYREGEGLSTRHGLAQELPDSVLETLTSQGTTRDTIRLKQMARRVLPMRNIIDGLHNLRVDVAPAKPL